MSREIKFRVKNTNGKIVGFECLFPVDRYNTDYQWASSINNIDWTDGIVKGNNLIRQQYTGIKDIRGTEIYEGDILKWLSDTYEVLFSKKKAAFICEWIKDRKITHAPESDFEVIKQ